MLQRHMPSSLLSLCIKHEQAGELKDRRMTVRQNSSSFVRHKTMPFLAAYLSLSLSNLVAHPYLSCGCAFLNILCHAYSQLLYTAFPNTTLPASFIHFHSFFS